MSDIDIIEQEGSQVLWIYKNLDGSSYISESGEASDAFLCDNDLLLTPSATRDIRRAVTEWVAAAPERAAAEARNKEADRLANLVHNAWENWQQDNKLLVRHAIPSVDGCPGDIAHEGMCILVDYPDWSEGRPYVSAVFRDPTWADVFLAFEDAIMATRDFHHRFLEGLYEVELEERPEGLNVPPNTTVLRFSTGS
jgi:hypothetical protein